MWIILEFRRLVKDLYQVFGDMALWCWSHDPPFGWLGDRFLDIYDLLTTAHYGLYLLAEDYEDLWERVIDVLTESDIFRLLRTWLNYAEDAWNWVLYAFSNVVAIVDIWWQATRITVQGWIETATQGFNELKVAWDEFWNVTWPGILADIASLKGEWINFWSITFPTLVSFTWLTTWWNDRLLDINSLIESWTLTLAPFWEGWQEIRDQVLEFFADPLKWLYDRLEDFMDRHW